MINAVPRCGSAATPFTPVPPGHNRPMPAPHPHPYDALTPDTVLDALAEFEARVAEKKISLITLAPAPEPAADDE